MSSSQIKIIAEIGWNHMGDMNLAEKMIVSAAHNGADICKFQTWSVKNIKPGPWDADGRKEMPFTISQFFHIHAATSAQEFSGT